MLFLLLSLNLWAQNTVVQAEKASDIEFERYLLENPQRQPYTDSLSTSLNQNKKSKELLALLKKAQYEFINGSLEQARIEFKNIFELRHTADWNLNQRKTIHYALFRLAQLEKDKSHYYIKASIVYDKDLQPNSKLFPPPLIALFHKLKNQQKSKVWPLPKGVENFKFVLVNGIKTDAKQSFIQTSPGVKRFSFISNKYEPINLITDVKKLALYNLNLNPLAQGHCESPQFSESLQNENFLSYYKSDCILPTNIQAPLTDLSQSPTHIPTNSIEKNYKSQNIWTWVGLTVLTAVVTWKVLENQQKSPHQNPSVQPTETHISNSNVSY